MALKSIGSFASALALIAVAGCGSSTSETSNDSSEPTATESAEPTPSESAEEPEKSDNAEPEKEPEAKPEDVVITISDFEYEGPETIAPGATVTVVNEDSAPHTVTSTEDKSLFDVDVEAGAEVTFTAPTEPGEYPYYCEIHPEMTAALVVK